jgi:hypothetical protein
MLEFGVGHHQVFLEGVQLCGVDGAVKVVQVVPEFIELPVGQSTKPYPALPGTGPQPPSAYIRVAPSSASISWAV